MLFDWIFIKHHSICTVYWHVNGSQHNAHKVHHMHRVRIVLLHKRWDRALQVGLLAAGAALVLRVVEALLGLASKLLGRVGAVGMVI